MAVINIEKMAHNVAEKAMQELRDNGVFVSRWIPVSERMPEESGDYLVTIKWKGSYSGDAYIEINIAEYRKKLKEWDCVDVIAWMPLPAPFEPQESEETRNEL